MSEHGVAVIDPPENEDDAPVEEPAPKPRRDWKALAPLLLVALPIVFNLVVLHAETKPVSYPNDTAVHMSLVQFAEQKFVDGEMPFDGWYPRLHLGVAAFHHYQPFAAIVGGAFATHFGAETTVQWSGYLLLSFWPLCVYITARLFGFKRSRAGITALISPLVSSVALYGFEHGSFTWRGNGIWSALWGMWLMPLALALSWRAVSRGKGYALAALFLGLSIATHFLSAYFALLCLGVWVVIVPREFLHRALRAAIVGIGAACVAAWVVVPLFADREWSAQSEYNGGFWRDSHGLGQVLSWLFTGELFDYQRWPVLSVLVAIGFVVCAMRARREESARAILGFTMLGLLLFCGRDVVGFVINRLPGGEDLLLHRYIIGLHLGGILLAGLGASWLVEQASALAKSRAPRMPTPALVGALVLIGLLVLTPAWRERQRYDDLNAQWIDEQRAIDQTDGRDFDTLAERASAMGGGRVFAGRPGTAPSLYAVPTYIELVHQHTNQLGWMLRLASISQDVEVNFDETNPAHYDLFNVRWVIVTSGAQPAVPATFVEAAGRWELWSVDTPGYLEVVDTAQAITADRTNLGGQTLGFLTSTQPADGWIPVIAMNDEAVVTPTAPFAKPSGSPGEVPVQYDLSDDGVFGGEVFANRRAVVMLKATYDPRWQVTVDGQRASIQMLAPAFVGVQVEPGRHTVEFHYEPFAYYWQCFLLGVLALVVLAVVPRYGPRALRAVKSRRTR